MNGEQKYLVICERDVGLFSLIQQVIANIPRALADGRVPVVLFGSRCSYYSPGGYQGSDNVWEYYFEPLIADTPAATIPPVVSASLARQLPPADDLGETVVDGFFATTHFGDHPDLKGRALKIPWKWKDPSDALRNVAAPIVERYIRPRDYILEKVERFYDEHLSARAFIGVQIRGTDSVSKAESRAFRSGALQPKAYIAQVARLLTEMPDAKIFVATDAESSLEFMKDRFGDRVVAYDSLRQGAGRAAGRGPQGGLLPAYIADDPDAAARNGEEAVIEYLLLCRAHTLVHNGASLARTVLLARPDMVHIRTNPSRPVRAYLTHYVRKIHRLITGDGTALASAPPKERLARFLRDLPFFIGNYFEERRDPNRPLVALVLWCTDHTRRILRRDPDVLVLARHNNAYLKKRGARRRGPETKILEIRNDFDHNAGFFVQVRFVLAQLKYAEALGLKPVVNLDQSFSFYYDPSRCENVWENYFEPVNDLCAADLDDLPPETFMRATPPVQLDKTVGDTVEHPTEDGPEVERYYKRRRDEASRLIRDYVRVKPHVLAKVDDFYTRYMVESPVLGVHLRGTDKGFRRDGRLYGFPAYAARVVQPEEYWPFADKFIECHPDCRILVAADQQRFVDAFREQYGERVLSFGDTRSGDATNTMHVDDGRNYQKGEDVLIDVLLLARTDFLLRCMSNVGEAATWFNPDLRALDLNSHHSLEDVSFEIARLSEV